MITSSCYLPDLLRHIYHYYFFVFFF